MAAWPTSIRSLITPTTTSVMGISTPSAVASSSTGPADLAPSATWVVTAATSATGMPRPIISPNVRFRDSGELQVATRSPSPARPAKVCWSAPSAAPSRVDLGQPAGDQRGPGVVPAAHADRDPDRPARSRS